MKNSSRLFVLAGIALVVVLILSSIIVGFYTDWLWFRHVGYGSVFWTRFSTEVIARAAHTLKSSSANLGATNVAAIARQIETSARGGEIAELASSITKLKAQRTVALSELEALDNAAKVA